MAAYHIKNQLAFLLGSSFSPSHQFFTPPTQYLLSLGFSREGLQLADLRLGFHEDELKDCIRASIAKGEEVTVTKVSERCKKPWRTVRDHFDNIIRQDLGDGTKVVHGKAVYDAVIRDPPGDEEMVINVEPHEDRPPSFWLGRICCRYDSWDTICDVCHFLVGLVVSKAHDACNWSPIVEANSWVRVCTICGRHGYRLNDQPAPIRLTQVNS